MEKYWRWQTIAVQRIAVGIVSVVSSDIPCGRGTVQLVRFYIIEPLIAASEYNSENKSRNTYSPDFTIIVFVIHQDSRN